MNLGGSQEQRASSLTNTRTASFLAPTRPPHGDDYPQQVFNDKLYEIYFRFLETDDEYFDYAPAPVPPQGRWKISVSIFPTPSCGKVYNQNAGPVVKPCGLVEPLI